MYLPTEMRIRMTRYMLTAVLTVFIILTEGCTDITEQENTLLAGLTVLSPDDFSVVCNLEGFSNARCIMVLPGYIFVLSADGKLYRIDATTFEEIVEFTVGPASVTGYSSMAFSPNEGTIYLIGAYGTILEVSFPDCEVLDEFPVGTAPMDLEITKGIPGYLWVADAGDNSISQVKLDNNVAYTSYHYQPDFVYQCMEASKWNDSLLVGTSIMVSRLEALSPGLVRNSFMDEEAMGVTDVSAIPNDSNFVVISTENYIGVLCAYDRLFYPDPPDRFYNSLPVSGSMFVLAAANDNLHTFALGYTGDGMSRLYRYSYIAANMQECVDLPGFPLDMKVSGTGMIYILTYQ